MFVVCYLVFAFCCQLRGLCSFLFVMFSFGSDRFASSRNVGRLHVACGPPLCGRKQSRQRWPLLHDLMAIAVDGRGLHVASG